MAIPWSNDVNHHSNRRFTQSQIEKAYSDSDFYFFSHAGVGTILIKPELTEDGFCQRVLSKWRFCGCTDKVSDEFGVDKVWEIIDGNLPESLLYGGRDYKGKVA